MKQKQVKTPAKAVKQTKTVNRSGPPKKLKKVVESDEEEEEIVVKKPIAKKAVKGKKVVKKIEDEEEEVVQVKKVAPKKPINNKLAKAKKVVEPEVEDEEDEDDEQEEQDDEEVEEESDEEEEEVEDAEEVEYEDDEQEDEDEDDEEEDNEEVGEDQDEENSDGGEGVDTDDDFELLPPEERSTPSEVLSGPLKHDYSPNQCVHVNQLPKKCKQINIVEAFAKYGAIKQINLVTTPNSTYADIAFKTPKAADAALADDKKLKVGDSVVSIVKRQTPINNKQICRERCVCVKNMHDDTTEEELREFFEPCGEIEYIKLLPPLHSSSAIAFVTFTKQESVPEALKLHNTVFKNSNIKVFENDKRESKQYDEDLTIMLRNKQNFSSIDVAKLESIFSKCGEIDYVDVLCRKQILGFITFKTKEAAEKAVKMNGETHQDVMLDVEPYNPLKKWTSINVTNIPKGCTEKDLKLHFAKAGQITSVTLKGAFAVIRFADTDGYCKSFLYNESFLKGHMIFIEPNSKRKQKILHKNFYNNKKGPKRSFENGHSAFKPKKPKFN